MGLVEDMYPSTSWTEWSRWFPIWGDRDLASLLKEVRCKRKQVEHLLAAKEEEERIELQQSSPAMNEVAFLKGVAKGLTFVWGVIEITGVIGNIPLTTTVLRFNLDKLLQTQTLAEEEMHRRKDREPVYSNSLMRN